MTLTDHNEYTVNYYSEPFKRLDSTVPQGITEIKQKSLLLCIYYIQV